MGLTVPRHSRPESPKRPEFPKNRKNKEPNINWNKILWAVLLTALIYFLIKM